MYIAKKIIIFDVETTGLNPAKDRVVQLTYYIVHIKISEDRKYVIEDIECKNFFFFEFSMNMDEMAEWINKINMDELEVNNDGRFLNHSEEIYKDFKHSIVVAHNCNFDKSFMLEEFKRAGYDKMPCYWVCSMRDLKSAYYRFPNPDKQKYGVSLVELFTHLGVEHSDIMELAEEDFKANIKGGHDARYDTAALLISLINMGYITIED